jgi:flagellar biosynthesis chaperone FliJ
MDKAERLEMLRKIGEQHREREELAFAGLPVTRQDIEETVADMDTYREERRQNKGEALTSDEA